MKMISSRAKHLKKNKMRLPLSAYLTYMLVATLLFTGVSFSQFATTSSGEDSARVAVMAMDAQYTVTQDIPIGPGETQYFDLILTNKDDKDRVCEVAQEYSVSLQNLSNNMNLAFEYFKLDGESETKVYSISGTFFAGTEQTATYRVKISWAGPQPASNAFEVDGLSVVISSEQID